MTRAVQLSLNPPSHILGPAAVCVNWVKVSAGKMAQIALSPCAHARPRGDVRCKATPRDREC